MSLCLEDESFYGRTPITGSTETDSKYLDSGSAAAVTALVRSKSILVVTMKATMTRNTVAKRGWVTK